MTTTNAKHTPGPWIAISNNNKTSRIENINGIPIIEDGYMPLDCNARLIAAAPDLLKALETALRYLEAITEETRNIPRVMNARELVEQAITKATGGQ